MCRSVSPPEHVTVCPITALVLFHSLVSPNSLVHTYHLCPDCAVPTPLTNIIYICMHICLSAISPISPQTVNHLGSYQHVSFLLQPSLQMWWLSLRLLHTVVSKPSPLLHMKFPSATARLKCQIISSQSLYTPLLLGRKEYCMCQPTITVDRRCLMVML